MKMPDTWNSTSGHHQQIRPIFEIISDPKATQTLPSLGTIIHELSHMMGKAHTPLQDISSLIQRDQSMSVRILRLANSAYFAPSQPILNVDEALLYLGLNQIRTSILTARCIEQTCAIPEKLFSWKDFWAHSVAVACLCRTLAFHLSHPNHNGETYYIMGLLHDIGKLALAYLSPENFEAVLNQAKEQKTETSRIEFELLGIDHSGLGAWYLEQQGLPPIIYKPIRQHHAWQMDPEQEQCASIIALADKFVHWLKIGQSGSIHSLTTPPFESEEWKVFEKNCEERGYEDEDTLKALVLQEAEKLPILVSQLTA